MIPLTRIPSLAAAGALVALAIAGVPATLTELEGALEREKKGQLELLDSHDFREGTKAFQQRRPATFTDS